MLSLQIAICESDLQYAQKLSKYLLSNQHYNLSIHLFSSQTTLLEFLKQNSIDILLIAEKQYLQVRGEINLHSVMILVEHFIDSNLRDHPYILKYQQGKSILNQIITYYTANSDQEILPKENQKTKLIGVYSPGGGSGKTTISIAIGNTLALQGKNTLFFSLEEIPSYSMLFECSLESSMSDLFYHIKKKTENLLMKLEGIQKIEYSTGLKYIPPSIYHEDMMNVEDEEWESFFQYLLETNYYDYIVIDITSEMSRRNNLLLEKCTKQIVLSNLEPMNLFKTRSYLANIIKKTNGKEKIMLVSNSTKLSETGFQEEIKDIKAVCEIPFSDNLYLYKGEKIQINLDNEFGQVIKRLIKGLNLNG